MTGVNSVPIRIAPATPKTSRATASRVDNEDDKVVPIKFGSKSLI